MKKVILAATLVLFFLDVFGQESNSEKKHYIGCSYGKSFAVGNFKDNDLNNTDAGFAKSGNKLDLYGGYMLNNKLTFTLTFRHQNFNTDIKALISTLEDKNPNLSYAGSSKSWRTYYLLIGAAYKINVTNKFALFPFIATGPMIASNPEFSINSSDGNTSNVVIRTSENGIGLGYDFGIGIRNNLGKHFALMPTFSFTGAFVRIADVKTNINNTTQNSTINPKMNTFNLGLSLAYKF